MTENQIAVHNVISPTYREFHVDGAFGGATPRGLININFYAERAPIPKSQIYGITPAMGMTDQPLSNSQDSKTGIMRHFEAGVFMDLNVAKSIIALMQNTINLMEAAMASVNQDEPKKAKAVKVVAKKKK